MQWNEFQYRNYDSRLERWLSPDPARQYASPYAGMGNNPISVYDPTGLWGYENKETGEFIWVNFESSDYFMSDDGTIWSLVATSIQDLASVAKAAGSSEIAAVDANYETATQEEVIIDGKTEVVTKFKDLTLADFAIDGRNVLNFKNPQASLTNFSMAGLGTAFIEAGLAVGSKIFFDTKAGTWTGKNFKSYSMEWGGNGYTGGKFKFARKVSSGLTLGDIY
ncbi:MAG TPA: hypothetical protein DCG19_08180 [Cryomorphaceae bacterium]|nr:hypothetical protein [Owenweeksia sp.]MBF99257.1 hypothetical protein [Owenweeksia sp.]HAD97370.1 hypothetical protein [Cryomorphaceae bacterium]HBF22093.1 hypothetical protein [Cryomorphaceae bacterium]